MTTTDNIRTLIVDDEIAFINTLEIMLEPFHRFEIIGQARNVAEGKAMIETMKPDVVFLDVELGDGTGFDILENLRHKSLKVIFVTAFDHYAVQAFRYSALDYLMKPLVREDLISAISKIEQTVLHENLDQQYRILLDNINQNQIEKKRIILKEVNTHHVIKIEDILMCQAEGSYTKFYLEDSSPIIVSRHLKEFEDLLPKNKFFRVHRSYLINLDKITRYERSEGGVLMLKGGTQIPVSIRKRESLTKILSNF